MRVVLLKWWKTFPSSVINHQYAKLAKWVTPFQKQRHPSVAFLNILPPCTTASVHDVYFEIPLLKERYYSALLWFRGWNLIVSLESCPESFQGGNVAGAIFNIPSLLIVSCAVRWSRWFCAERLMGGREPTSLSSCPQGTRAAGLGPELTAAEKEGLILALWSKKSIAGICGPSRHSISEASNFKVRR